MRPTTVCLVSVDLEEILGKSMCGLRLSAFVEELLEESCAGLVSWVGQGLRELQGQGKQR